MVETGPKTFFLLIAVQRFAAGDLHKTLISIPGSLGMILSVLLIPLLARGGLPATRLLALSRALSGLCYLMAAWRPELDAYAFWIFLGGLPASIAYPLLTAVYHENYPHRVRGQLFAWASMVNMASAALSAWLIAMLLGPDSEGYRPALAVIGAASLLAAWSLLRMPPASGAGTPGTSFFRAFAWIAKDKRFAYMLAIWFTFGFASFLATPVRVLYLTDPRFGLAYQTSAIALMIGVLPEIARGVATPIWARLFDRTHFISVRLALNAIQAIGLAVFFFGPSTVWRCAGAVLEGVAGGGANLAWALWVTHMAPPGHTTEYMSVNQFFTGVRGILGTWLGITMVSWWGTATVAWTAIALIALSIALMLPLRGDKAFAGAHGKADGDV